jgi:hypothetical protein
VRHVSCVRCNSLEKVRGKSDRAVGLRAGKVQCAPRAVTRHYGYVDDVVGDIDALIVVLRAVVVSVFVQFEVFFGSLVVPVGRASVDVHYNASSIFACAVDQSWP